MFVASDDATSGSGYSRQKYISKCEFVITICYGKLKLVALEKMQVMVLRCYPYQHFLSITVFTLWVATPKMFYNWYRI